MYNYLTQPLFQGQQMQPFGQMPQQAPGGPLAGPVLGQNLMQPPVAPGAGQQHHHGFGHILPYLAMGLLGGSLMGGNIAPMFGLGGIAAKHFGLFK